MRTRSALFRFLVATGCMAAAAALTAYPPSVAHACDCVFPSPAAALDRAHTVFVGTVVSAETSEWWVLPWRSVTIQESTFRVSRRWKGAAQPLIKVTTVPPLCGFTFTVGETYLVFARFDPFDGTPVLTTDQCALTQPLANATDTLAAIGPGLPVGRVCPKTEKQIPPTVVQESVDFPERFAGWGQLADPGKPGGPSNPYRVWLSLRNPGTAYGPYNRAVWRAGCS